MKNLQSWVRNIFGFTETEARGFWVLSLLMFIFILLPVIYRLLPTVTPKGPVNEDKALDSLIAELEMPEQAKEKKYRNSSKKSEPVAFFRFDPNTATETELAHLGFKTKTVHILLKYRKNGGKFRVKKDMLRIYGLDPQHFMSLEKFIELPDTIQNFSPRAKLAVKEHSKSDINTADTIDLQKLKGIGSKLSVRIFKYREALGGFTDTAQFREVYGLDSFTIALLNKHFFISPQYQPKQIKINFSSVEVFSKHPYLGKKLAKIVANYRAQHQAIHSFQEFSNILGVPETMKQKLKPYLDYGLEKPADNIEDK